MIKDKRLILSGLHCYTHHNPTLSIKVHMGSSTYTLNSCRKIELEEPLYTKGAQDEISKQGLEADENIRTENSESIDKDTQDDKSNQETSDKLNNNIMFYNSEVNFAFIYPQEYLTISSYPGWSGDYGDLSLNVSINAIENLKGSEKEDAISERDALKTGNFGSDTDFSFKPSRKAIKISDTFVKEFLVFARYDICDVVFDWEAYFYNNDYQIQITLSADKEKIMESMDQYFIYDEANCSDQKVWDFDKQDEFYDKLTTGQASSPASEWFDIFDSFIQLLQINDFKGASAGYSRLIDKRFFEENLEEKYLIDVSYPQFQSAAAGGLDESINKIIYEQKVLSTITDFKDEISSYQDEDFAFNYFLAIDYSVVMYDENGISVYLDIYPYLGGAHGMLYYETINFDLEKMSLIEIGELFVAGYDYLG